MPGEVLPKQPPIKPEKPQKRFEVIEGGKKEVKKVEKKDGGKTPPRRIGLKIGAGIGAGVLLGGGGAAAAYYIQHEQAQSGDQITQDEQGNPVAVVTAPETIVPETTAPPTTETAPPTTETAPETTAEVIINAPEIDGLMFDKETKTYFAKADNPYGLKEGEIAGVYVKDSLEINGELQDAVGLKVEVIRNILEKNKENYIFKIPWPIDLQKHKGIVIKEIIYLPRPNFPQELVGTKEFGIKVTNPIEIFCPSDTVNLTENILQPSENFPYSLKILLFDVGIIKKEKDKTLFAGFYFAFNSDWNSLSIELGKDQKNTREVKIGQLIGKINPDLFLEVLKREDWFENAGNYNFSLQVFNLDEDKSIEKKILTLGKNHLTVFILSDNLR